MIDIMIDRIITVFFRIFCLFGMHTPLMKWSGRDQRKNNKEQPFETVCISCGKYLVGNKVSDCPELKNRVEAFIVGVNRDLDSL
jgi:hypothetical protein